MPLVYIIAMEFGLNYLKENEWLESESDVRMWLCEERSGENNHFKPLWFSSLTYLRFFERAQLQLIPRISSKYSNWPFWPFTYCRGHLKMAPLASALSS